MKNLFLEALIKAKQERRKSSARSAHPLLKITSMVILLLMVSVNVWGNFTPGANYTKVTNPSSQLSTYDQVILYEEATGMGVTGSDGTDATLSATEAAWTIYNVQSISGSTVELGDISSSSRIRYLSVESESTHYNFKYSDLSGDEFTISNSGLLQYSGTHLAHNGTKVRFYSSAGTPLYVYKLNTPNPLTPASNDGLEVVPAEIYMSGKSDNGEAPYGLFYSAWITCTSDGHKNVNHRVSITGQDFPVDMWVNMYEEDIDHEAWSGYFTPSSTYEWVTFRILCYAPQPGTFHATLTFTEFGTHATVEVPIVITVTADCTPRTLSFTNGTTDKTIYWTGSKTYTNAATASAGTGTIAYDIVADPDGCASVNSSGVVTFTSMGTAVVSADIPAVGDYCAAHSDYTITMTCEPRTLSFTTTEPTVSITSGNGTYSQAPTVSAGSGHGTITYTIDSDDDLTIDPSTGVVSFNGNAGTAMVTATISEADGYCSANNSYFLTVTPVVPTVSAFTPSATETSITMTGSEVTNKGGSAITRYGYIYSTTLSTPETLIYGASGAIDANVGTNDIALNTGFEKTVTGLSAGNTYYVRAYATNAAGTGYSDIQTIKTVTYEDYVFTCAELTLTPKLVTAGTPIFITSSANKTVRSQDSILIVGSGLTPNQALEFPGLNSKFTIKSRANTALSVEEDGTINAVAYIFYTPGEDETTDGLLKITGLTVSVGGTKPKTATLTQNIIGRHLPTAGYVIAGKKDNKWYALPSNMASTGTPAPSEIAVDDINNPSIAYTDASNIYGLEGPTTSGGGNNIASGYGQYVRLTMSINDGNEPAGPAPLFGSSSTAPIGKSDNAKATSNLSAGYWWELKQTNTSITNPQDAKYTIKCANNSSTLSIKNSPFQWGLYASGVEELRLIPASNIIFTEAYFVEWGQHGGIIEVDAGATGINATSVVAHLGENSSSATLTNAGTSGKPATTTKYNYIVDFGNDIDFAAAASNGALLTLEWKNGETVKAMTSLVVPKIIATSATMSSLGASDGDWNSKEVHVLPGVTLEADAYGFGSDHAVTIDQLEIYPGATVKVTTGTLDVRKLALRNGWKRIGGKAYDVARLHIATTASLTKTNNTDKWYSDWYIDFDQYYPIAVPWPVTVANMSYKNTRSAVSVGPGNSNSVRLRYYDGNSRATNIQEGVGSGANWKQYGDEDCDPVPTTLEPSHGYAMTARRPTGKAFSIIRMPLTFTNAWGALGEQGSVDETHKDQVDVTAYGVKPESKTVYAEGWNFIANPYMSLYQGTITLTPEEGDATTINVVNIPDVDFKEYGQYATATTKLKPSSGFLIQTPEDGKITFGTANRKASAPSYRKTTQAETYPEQQAYIVLNDETSEDMMGIFVSDKYTAEYDLNGDVEKLLSDGTSLRTYMHYGNMNLAYVALTETLAQEWIPVTVRIPSTGEYTFSMHEASIAGELEGVYLIDYANNDQITNLIDENYTFTAEAGTINNRFAINAIVGERQIPTDIDVVNGGGDLSSDKPFKFIYHDKVYIYHRGVIYDATGKRVKEINK